MTARGATPPTEAPTVVVGGGLAGLTAAVRLADAGRRVLVLEASTRVGGKLQLGEVAGVVVDVGAEAMLARRPEGSDLAASLDLPLEEPATTASRIWTRGGLRPLPRSLMGAPLDRDDLAASGVLTPAGLERAAAEVEQPATVLDPGSDVSVGDLVDARFGAEVTDRLVEPLLGGVYAGHARRLSARACVPQLVALAERGPILGADLPTVPGPVFTGIAGGMGLLPAALAADPRVDVRTGVTVRALRRTTTGFALTVGETRDGTEIVAAEVVVAVPAAPAARLLGTLAPAAATRLADLEYASMAVVTLAFAAADLPDLPGSGFLVPPADGRRIKASTFSFAKWGWVREAGDAVSPEHPVRLLRTSIGRHGEERSLQVDDPELVAASLEDLRDATGLAALPVDTHVQRWGGGLPQYAVGHLDRVAAIREAVAAVPGLAVCGAAYDGVGIPAVIASADRAVADLTRGA